MIKPILALAAAASLTAAGALAQTPAPAPAPAAPAAAPAKLSIRTSLKDLLDRPAAKAVLEKHIPKVLAHPQMQDVWQEPLENIATYPEAGEAGLTAETLKAIEAELAKL
jgi:hypothetical protein